MSTLHWSLDSYTTFLIDEYTYVIAGAAFRSLGVYVAGSGSRVDFGVPSYYLCPPRGKENLGAVNFPVPPRTGNFLSRLYEAGPGMCAASETFNVLPSLRPIEKLFAPSVSLSIAFKYAPGPGVLSSMASLFLCF